MLLTKQECLSEKILIIKALSEIFNDVSEVLLRPCSHFAERFCSEILMLSNDLSTNSAECSRMKCPYVIETGQFKQSLNI